jgi:hypothetical protein
MYRCWKCQNPLILEGRVGRQELCPTCQSALHACKNCQFWDPGAHNQCREPQAAYVPDREGGNFCDYFSFLDSAEGAEDRAAARTKLEAAFASMAAKGRTVVTPPSNDPRARLDKVFGGTGAPSPKSKVVTTEKDAKKRLEELFKKK